VNPGADERLAADCCELLGCVSGSIAVRAPGGGRLAAALVARLGTPAGRPAGAIVVFVGAPAEPAGRQALLARLRAELSPAAPLVLVDHTQPRRWWARALAALRLAAGCLPPARARYPAARELVALGFTVECLRLARGERLQLVRARR